MHIALAGALFHGATVYLSFLWACYNTCTASWPAALLSLEVSSPQVQQV